MWILVPPEHSVRTISAWSAPMVRRAIARSTA